MVLPVAPRAAAFRRVVVPLLPPENVSTSRATPVAKFAPLRIRFPLPDLVNTPVPEIVALKSVPWVIVLDRLNASVALL